MEDIMKLKDRARDAVKIHHGAAVALSDDLAATPEISSFEFESSRKIVEFLKSHGYKGEVGGEIEYPYLGYDTAFRGVLKNGSGPKVAIMVEYDALPDIGHGCGHNLHGSLSVLAACALNELKDLYNGEIHVIGTPAEELDGAKTGMSDKGAFDGFSLAMMMHSVGGGVCQPNMSALSLRCCVIEFLGRPAHTVGAPWEGRSALGAARKFLDLVDARRECFTPDMRANGIITEGGLATNIIPERAAVRMEFRTGSMAALERLDDMVKKCARGAAMALECEVNFKLAFQDFADMIRLPSIENEVTDIFKALGEKVSGVEPPMGSTDVGNVSYRCPSIQPLIAIVDKVTALHTKDFADATLRPRAHDAMAKGAETLVLLALKTLRDGDFRRKVEEEFLSARTAKTA
ncbi:amidohydrolase [Synergistales bacterium]|nr:amidohydrolase [Synergistales bacterium]